MRISGGLAKGRQIATKSLLSKTLGDERLRPTSSKVREALFDIIKNRIKGASFVDLYAGTGTVGLEALSRGAEKVFFVEPNELRIGMIKRAVEKFGFLDKAVVVKCRAYEFLKKAIAKKDNFDIFFLDPPYQSEEIMKTLPLLGEKGVLNMGGIVIVEHYVKKKLPETTGKLMMRKSYRYGDTMLTFYRSEDEG